MTNMVSDSEVPWIQVAPGIEIKVLRKGEGTGMYTMLARFRPGTRLPTHRHFGQVHVYTIEGIWGYAEYDWRASTGDYVYEPTGAVHSLVIPEDAPGPTTLFMVIESGMMLMDDSGDMLAIEDSASLDGYYRAALDAAGIPYPDGVLD